MNRLRIVSYAINGRGMGHLVRQLSILRWVRRISALLDIQAECWVLTSSEADTLARREGFPALKMPSKAMLRDAGIEPHRVLTVARTWVMNAIAGLQPDVLVVDTFPGGSFGELVPALELARHRVLVARRVRPEFAEEDPYRALLPLYDRVVVPDERQTGPIMLRERSELLPRDAARTALGVPAGKRAVYVSLGGGGEVAAARTLPRLVDMLAARDWHVVVGAGPLYDGPERRGPGITWLSRYAPVELFCGLDAAVASAGYNTFHELMFAGVPTVFLPLARIADDQAERAARAEAAGAGRVARALDDVPALLDDCGTTAAAQALVPVNGARAAAVAVLSTVLPKADLDLAVDVLGPELLGLLDRAGAGASKAMRLLRMLAGGTPSQLARRRAVLAELAEQGHAVPEVSDRPTDAGPRLARFVQLCESSGAPFDTALSLADGLHRKFPAEGGGALLDALAVLLPAWGRFDDWMGAIALLRALPTQRGLTLARFAEDTAAWLACRDDLFECVAEFSRLEGSGQRTVGEVLRILRTGQPGGPPVLESEDREHDDEHHQQ